MEKKIKGLLEEEYFKAYREANKDKIAERFRNTHVYIPLFGGRGGKSSIYTNGVTKEIKEQLPKIVNDVLEDCIKNPKKYLDESGENTLPSVTSKKEGL